MNLIEFTNNLNDPRNTSAVQTDGLKNIIDEFPYFHAAHFLYLNGLKNQNSFKYNNYLKKTAAYTTDRSVLFDFISTYQFNYQPHSGKTTSEEKPESIKTPSAEVIQGKTAIEEPAIEEAVIEETSEKSDALPIGKPFKFDHSETHSFSEWLEITSVKPIQRKKSATKETGPAASGKSNFDIIDNFITKNPKIRPSVSSIHSNVAVESVTENESLMTETLAHVYLEQKKFQKAITAFTVLSLKYPEKSSFFANQIKAIKKLQEK